MNPFVIYFPQFHPTTTNDKAWGAGFTDWALVANANVHERWQRRAPARGFYDGASRELHHEHFAEIRASGLGGAALYHYWFYSHQELGEVEKTLLSSTPEATVPWFLVWASEGWSRRWLGDASSLVHLPTAPSRDQIERHCDYLVKCFAHPTYLSIGGRPLFVWYHLAHFDKPGQVVDDYRKAFERRGFNPLLLHFVKSRADAVLCSLVDGSYLFEPRLYFSMQRRGRGPFARALLDRVRRTFGSGAGDVLLSWVDKLQQKGRTYPAEGFLEYLTSDARKALSAAVPGLVQDVLSPGWNNCPRYAERYTALEDLPAAQFGDCVARSAAQDSLPVLINAWNEWSEGAAVEPCVYLGTRYLDSLKRGPMPASESRASERPVSTA